MSITKKWINILFDLNNAAFATDRVVIDFANVGHIDLVKAYDATAEIMVYCNGLGIALRCDDAERFLSEYSEYKHRQSGSK